MVLTGEWRPGCGQTGWFRAPAEPGCRCQPESGWLLRTYWLIQCRPKPEAWRRNSTHCWRQRKQTKWIKYYNYSLLKYWNFWHFKQMLQTNFTHWLILLLNLSPVSLCVHVTPHVLQLNHPNLIVSRSPCDTKYPPTTFLSNICFLFLSISQLVNRVLENFFWDSHKEEAFCKVFKWLSFYGVGWFFKLNLFEQKVSTFPKTIKWRSVGRRKCLIILKTMLFSFLHHNTPSHDLTGSKHCVYCRSINLIIMKQIHQ